MGQLIQSRYKKKQTVASNRATPPGNTHIMNGTLAGSTIRHLPTRDSSPLTRSFALATRAVAKRVTGTGASPALMDPLWARASLMGSYAGAEELSTGGTACCCRPVSAMAEICATAAATAGARSTGEAIGLLQPRYPAGAVAGAVEDSCLGAITRALFSYTLLDAVWTRAAGAGS